MESITFNYKTKLEQFEEQFPELYQEIYNLGYEDGSNAAANCYADAQDDHDNYQPQYAVPTDDSPRYYKSGSWKEIYKKALNLVIDNYKGNKSWEEFMKAYKNWKYSTIYIAWNPTHKEFAVESKHEIIDMYYPNLVNAKKFVS